MEVVLKGLCFLISCPFTWPYPHLSYFSFSFWDLITNLNRNVCTSCLVYQLNIYLFAPLVLRTLTNSFLSCLLLTHPESYFFVFLLLALKNTSQPVLGWLNLLYFTLLFWDICVLFNLYIWLIFICRITE